MKKKIFLQIFLIFLILIFSFIFLNQTLKEEKKIVSKVEVQKKEPENNMIEGIKYFSKDMKGKTYLIESKNGTINKENPDIIIASWCGKKVKKEKIKKRNGWEKIKAVNNNEIHEIKSEIILQPGPASITDGVELMHEIFSNWYKRNFVS